MLIAWGILNSFPGRLAMAALGLLAAYTWAYNRGYNAADTQCELRVEEMKRKASEDTQKGIQNVLEQIERARVARELAERLRDTEGDHDPNLRSD